MARTMLRPLIWDGGDYIYHSPGAFEEFNSDLGENQERKFMRYSISGDSWSEGDEAPYSEHGGWDDGGGIVRVGNTIYGLKGGDDMTWSENDTTVGAVASWGMSSGAIHYQSDFG